MEFSGGQHHTVCLDAEGKVQLTGFPAPDPSLHFVAVESFADRFFLIKSKKKHLSGKRDIRGSSGTLCIYGNFNI